MAAKMSEVNIFPILATSTKSVTSPYRSRLIFINRVVVTVTIWLLVSKQGYKIYLQKLSSN